MVTEGFQDFGLKEIGVSLGLILLLLGYLNLPTDLLPTEVYGSLGYMDNLFAIVYFMVCISSVYVSVVNRR